MLETDGRLDAARRFSAGGGSAELDRPAGGLARRCRIAVKRMAGATSSSGSATALRSVRLLAERFVLLIGLANLDQLRVKPIDPDLQPDSTTSTTAVAGLGSSSALERQERSGRRQGGASPVDWRLLPALRR